MQLLIDPQIRHWVFLPIVLLTFLVDMVRHYVTILVTAENTPTLLQIQDSQYLMRSRLLRKNGHYLPKQSFSMRKEFFNHPVTGYFKTEERSPASQNSTTLLHDMVKGNFVNALPMLIVGSLINCMFSGFVTTRVPFPLTLRFKPMLQRGVEVATLDACWVSSVSWYFLNVFGLRSFYSLFIDTNIENDWLQNTIDATNMAAVTLTQDTRAAFKLEWEALELASYYDRGHFAWRNLNFIANIYSQLDIDFNETD